MSDSHLLNCPVCRGAGQQATETGKCERCGGYGYLVACPECRGSEGECVLCDGRRVLPVPQFEAWAAGPWTARMRLRRGSPPWGSE